MKFLRLDHCIDTCTKHLDATNSRGTEAESYLVSFLLIRACAEFEMCLVAIFVERATKAGDQHLVNVIRRWAVTAKNRMKISDLTGHVATFGDDYKTAFRVLLDDPGNAPAKAAWDSIHSDRVNVAHTLVSCPTLSDFEKFYTDSLGMLDALATALGLTQADISTLTWP